MSSYEHLLAAAAAQKMANPDIPLAAYDVGFNAVKSSNTTNTALCLSNLPYSLKEDDISAMFDKVVNVNILRHRDTNKPRGMAIVQFVDATHCNIAYDLCQGEHIEADGRVIRGDYSRNDRSNQSFGQPPPQGVVPDLSQVRNEWKPRPPPQQQDMNANRWNNQNQRDPPPARGFQDRPPREEQNDRRSRFDAPPPGVPSYPDPGQFQSHPPPRSYDDNRGSRGGGYRGGFNDRRESGGYNRGYDQQEQRGYGGEQRGYQDDHQGGSHAYNQGRGYEDRRGGGFNDRGGRGGFNDRRGGGPPGRFPPRGGFRGGGGGGGGRGGFRDRSEENGPKPSKYGVTSACVRELPSSGRPQRPSSSSSSGSGY